MTLLLLSTGLLQPRGGHIFIWQKVFSTQNNLQYQYEIDCIELCVQPCHRGISWRLQTKNSSTLAMWYCHVDEADTETEKHYIHSTRVRQATPHPTRTVGCQLTVQILSRLWQKGTLKQSRMPVIEYDGASVLGFGMSTRGTPRTCLTLLIPQQTTCIYVHLSFWMTRIVAATPLNSIWSKNLPAMAATKVDTMPVPSILACSIKTPSNDSTVATPPTQLVSDAPGVDEPKPSTQLAKAKATFQPLGTKSGW
ncbi:hypothetical protein EDC04DRAFT_2613294 [Pisolithus marmoratus]|nr:hypothetical protein EDC04DRAFT_2613294 [Pisolithus marmoratus]